MCCYFTLKSNSLIVFLRWTTSSVSYYTLKLLNRYWTSRTVGQVTPSMITHLGFGTFIFFGVRLRFRVVELRIITGLLTARRDIRLDFCESWWLFVFSASSDSLSRFPSTKTTLIWEIKNINPLLHRTKGLTLEEMDVVFGDSAGTAAADRERQARVNKEVGFDAYGTDFESVTRK